MCIEYRGFDSVITNLKEYFKYSYYLDYLVLVDGAIKKKRFEHILTNFNNIFGFILNTGKFRVVPV